MWHIFKLWGLDIGAKIYDTPSKFGIYGGRISKLSVSKWDKELLNYERSWDFNCLPQWFTKLLVNAIEHMF